MFGRVFAMILDMTARGSIAILGVILARFCLRRAPKVFSYALWAVVLLRLICPVGVQLPVSVVPEMESVAGQYRFEHDPITVIDASKAAYQVMDDAAKGELNTQQVYIEVPSQLGQPRMRAATLLEIVVMAGQYLWLTGVLVFVFCSVVSDLRLRKRLVGAMCLEGNVYLADRIPTPFVLGIWKPRIYLPSGLEPRERDYIIAHERHHIRRRDPAWKLIALAALMLHWFNPLVWLAYALFSRDMETSCDEAVIKKLGTGIRADYAASLLRLSTGGSFCRISPLAFGEGDTKGRIVNLARWKKPAVWVISVSVIGCLVVALCLLTDPIPNADSPTLPSEPTLSGDASAGETVSSDLVYVGYTAETELIAAALNARALAQSDARHLPIYKFESREQLDAFTGTFGKFFALNQSYEELPSFYGVAQQYDQAFFRERSLLLVYITASSGSCRFDLDGIYCGINRFTVQVKKTEDSMVHTDEMGGWFLLVAVPDTMIASTESFDAELTDSATLRAEYDPDLNAMQLTGYARETNFSGLSQKVKNAVADQWKLYDAMTPMEHALSSRLFGEVTFRAQTWEQCQEDLGLTIPNPAEKMDWLTPTDVYGGIATSDEILHTQTDIYAMDPLKRTVERVAVSAGYTANGLRVILKASLHNGNSLFMHQLQEDAQPETRQSGTGKAVLLINEAGTERYTSECLYWIEDNVYYSLRVVGKPEEKAQIENTVEKLLGEI